MCLSFSLGLVRAQQAQHTRACRTTDRGLKYAVLGRRGVLGTREERGRSCRGDALVNVSIEIMGGE